MNTAPGMPPAATPLAQIESRILLVRGLKVMIDADLAQLYGVPTKRLNEQVKRNVERFPPDFMFTLTQTVKAEVVANCDHLAKLKFSKTLPFAFTEHGAIQAANVLASPQADRARIGGTRICAVVQPSAHAQQLEIRDARAAP